MIYTEAYSFRKTGLNGCGRSVETGFLQLGHWLGDRVLIARGKADDSEFSLSPPPVILTAAKTSKVHYNGNQQNQKIDTLQWLSCVHHPCVNEGRQWYKYESCQK